jgi:hypothetical protein
MIKKTLKVDLNQSAQDGLTFTQYENELGTITSSVRDQKGKYIVTIPDAFVGFVNFFCPQNKQVFNVVGNVENSFVLFAQIVSDSEIEITTQDIDGNYWEDSLAYVPLQLDVYFHDFLPTV